MNATMHPLDEKLTIIGVETRTSRSKEDVTYEVVAITDEAVYETGDNERGVWMLIVPTEGDFSFLSRTLNDEAYDVHATARAYQARIADDIWKTRVKP